MPAIRVNASNDSPPLQRGVSPSKDHNFRADKPSGPKQDQAPQALLSNYMKKVEKEREQKEQGGPWFNKGSQPEETDIIKGVVNVAEKAEQEKKRDKGIFLFRTTEYGHP